jgi:hypothetical protein
MAAEMRSAQTKPSYQDPQPSGIAVPARRAGDPAVERLVREAVALGLPVEVAEDL